MNIIEGQLTAPLWRFMHQLASYLKEREGVDSLITSSGFATYIISGDECYIRDIWIKPEFRKRYIATEIANQITEIAKKSKCKFLTGTVSTTANNPTDSVKTLLAYGFDVHSAIPNGIIFRKDL